MKARSTGSGGFRTAYYTDDDFMYDDDMDYVPPARKKPAPLGIGGKERPGAPKRPAPAHSPPPGAGGQASSPNKAVRSRPTNNQLLYKAYFRWAHYPHKLKNANLPVETDACASVTAAFLQVLQIMQTAEQLRHGNNKRNVLQILSSNTRRTKVVELSSGTHRVPDELKKHYLSDGEGGQYSTNLDRNRYGNDDNYLFTVIRYDLEFLGLCPCMVDVEIIDAKQGNSSIIVSAGTELCTCQGGPPLGAAAAVAAPNLPPATATLAPTHSMHHHHGAPGPSHPQLPPAAATLSGGGGHPAVKTEYPGALGPLQVSQPAAGGTGGFTACLGGGAAHDVGGALPPLFGPGSFRGGLGLAASGRESPKRSGTSVSQLFDALVMAATGGADGAAAAGGLGGEPPVTSPAHADRPDRSGLGCGHGLGLGASGGGPRVHGPPGRNKSKLWSLNNLSFGGEVDSLQNALDAFREQDEIASGDHAAFFTGGVSAGGMGPDGSLQRSDSLRQRRRKPLRNSSTLGRPASSGGVAPMGMQGSKLALREKSDDNLKLAAVHDMGAVMGGGIGGPGGYQAGGGGMPPGAGATQVSSLASGEDDNDGGAGDVEADDALAAKGEDLGMEGEGEAGGDEEVGDEDGPSGAGVGHGGGGVGPTASATFQHGFSGGRMPPRHHVRHVPRQSSVANLAPRVANSAGGGGFGGGVPGGGGMGPLGGLGMMGPGGLGGSASAAIAGEQLRRMANELEVVRHENRNLRQQLQRASSSTGAGNGGGGGGSPGLGGKGQQPSGDSESARLRKLEAELSSMRSELLGLNSAKKTADEENKMLKRELTIMQQQVTTLTRILGATAVAGGGVAGLAPTAATAAVAPTAGATPSAAALAASSVAGILASLMGGAPGAPPVAAAASGVATPTAAQPLLGAIAGAFDPSSFAAQFAALRHASVQQQQQLSAEVGGAAAGVVVEGQPAAVMVGAPALLSGHTAGIRTETARGEAQVEGQDPNGHGRKRRAEEAELFGALASPSTGAGGPSGDGSGAVLTDKTQLAVEANTAVAQLATEPQQQHDQVSPMPSFTLVIPGTCGMPVLQQQPVSQALSQQPLDSGAVATPADSTCFSDVAQLLTLPNLDNGFTSSDLGAPFGGGAGTGVGAVIGGFMATGLAASSDMPVSGSGTGSGTASVPQMPQLDPALLGTPSPYGAPQLHAGMR